MLALGEGETAGELASTHLAKTSNFLRQKKRLKKKQQVEETLATLERKDIKLPNIERYFAN